jgi:cytochrome P450
MTTTVPRQAKPPGLPLGRVRTGWQLLVKPDLLSGETLFGDAAGDLVHWRVGRQHFFASRSPDHVEHVFVAGHDRYQKAVHYRLIAAVTGEGLLTNEGESWAHQRRLIQPIFSKRHLHDLAPLMVAATEDFVARLEARDRSRPVDVAEAMSDVTLDVVGRALFGASLSDAAQRLRPAVVTSLHTAVVAARLQLLVTAPRRLVDFLARLLFRAPALPPPLGRVRNAMRTIDAVVSEVIDARTAQPTEGSGDLLDLLLTARDETGEAMDRSQVRDEVVTLMLAGHETTANGLAWMWYLLALHPEARDRLYAEVDEVLGDRVPSADDAERLPWTRACFEEAMRIYPPAWVLEREAVDGDELDGYRVPKGSTVIFMVHVLHRDPRWWSDPEAFDPRRFLPDAPPPPRGAYLPFGAGRRMCVGASFALLEATLIAAMVAQRFTLDLAPDADVVPEPTVTLRPRNGLPMLVRPRL